MIIGCVGFSYSGSSAVCDLLMEFEENQVFNRIEFILAYEPDGLEDLDYHLNKGCSKFLSSSTAIPRFRRIANFRLKKVTNGKIKKITDDYLNSITQVKWVGLCNDAARRNLWLFRNVGTRLNERRVIRRIPPRLTEKLKLYPLGTVEYAIQPEFFYERTREYTDEILKSFGLDLTKNIVLDQPFAGNDPGKSLVYFRDARAIIVDRDPRDIYILAKKIYRRQAWQIPTENVDDYIRYYANMHKQLVQNQICQNNDPNILYVRFEDLVYNYEAASGKIMQFLGLKEQTHPGKCFDPGMSMINTQLYRKYPEFQKEIEQIERSLPEWIFHFEDYPYTPKAQEFFDQNPKTAYRKKKNRGK